MKQDFLSFALFFISIKIVKSIPNLKIEVLLPVNEG